MPPIKISKKPFDYQITDGITQSMLVDFLTCREKSRLKLNRWEGIHAGSFGALHRGDFIHYFLEHIYQAGGHEHLFEEWCKKNKHDESHPDILQIGEVCSALLPAYTNHWKSRDIKYEWVSLEKTFDVTWNGFRLRGKIDGILKLTVNGSIYIFETKTKAQVDEDGIINQLQFDFQNFFYLTVCRDILNIPAKGIIYNIIRWPNSRLKKDLTSHIREDPNHYFKRYEVAYSLKDVQIFRDELISILLDFNAWRKGQISHYKNPSACFKGNMKCEFLKICSSGTTAGFSKSRILFRELL
jgi:hypothetical protein